MAWHRFHGEATVIFSFIIEATPSILLCFGFFLSTLSPIWITGQVKMRQKPKQKTSELSEFLHSMNTESSSSVVKACLMYLLQIQNIQTKPVPLT
jgi:hypothetical protein